MNCEEPWATKNNTVKATPTLPLTHRYSQGKALHIQGTEPAYAHDVSIGHCIIQSMYSNLATHGGCCTRSRRDSVLRYTAQMGNMARPRIKIPTHDIIQVQCYSSAAAHRAQESLECTLSSREPALQALLGSACTPGSLGLSVHSRLS
jgi:hypothetical protein